MKKEKPSFFERITGMGRSELTTPKTAEEKTGNWVEQSKDDAQLAIDAYQTGGEIIITAMIAGVKPEDLDISITREMVIIKGKREEPNSSDKESYIYRELYWGSFSRTIVLPVEVESDESEAVEKHGLLIIRMPKINKDKSKTLKIKSL
ncbi:MAG: Hsp20/alpha crystallin family protein [Candidatus Vogelbacteria bacterium]|nr:Hsp20/alpha crystallin family protein [Candidatus Vogelbacteria bacterium]